MTYSDMFINYWNKVKNMIKTDNDSIKKKSALSDTIDPNIQ